MTDQQPTATFYIHIDDFVGPDRRFDAFPSVRYTLPRYYQADTIVIKFAVNSAVAYTIEGRSVYMEPGDLLLVAPYAGHSGHSILPEGQILNIVIRPSRIGKVLPRVLDLDSPVSSFFRHCMEKNGPLFMHLPASQIDYDMSIPESIVDYCIREKNPRSIDLFFMEARLEELLLDILRSIPETEQLPLKRTEAADELSIIFGFIQHHLSDASLDLTAKELGWNTSHLSRFIKKKTGRSFTDLIQVLRLDEAASLLLTTADPVEEIMRRVGYTGKTHFYNLFLDRFHVSPAEYRRMSQVSAQTNKPGDTDDSGKFTV